MKKTSHTCNCFGLQIVATNLQSAVHTVCKHLSEHKGEYITFVNVHALIETQDNEEYYNAQCEAYCNFADGKPISLYQKKKDYVQVERVAGPDFMREILKISVENGYRHYFYGSSPLVVEKMVWNVRQQYPEIQIVGRLSPAKRLDIKKDDFEFVFANDIAAINATNPDFVWIGLGAPKQELFMYYAKGKIDGLMLGVGAAFDFFAETKKRAPKLLQIIGLEWFYRLLQDPKRLFKRYFVTNIKFIKMCLEEKR